MAGYTEINLCDIKYLLIFHRKKMQKNKEIGEYRGAPIYERFKKVKYTCYLNRWLKDD